MFNEDSHSPRKSQYIFYLNCRFPCSTACVATVRNASSLRSWEIVYGFFHIYPMNSFNFISLSHRFSQLVANMGKPWVLPSFKQILIDSSAEYLTTSNKEKAKDRTIFINRIVEEIRQAVVGTNDTLPDDLPKVHCSPTYSRRAGNDIVSPSTHGSEMRPVDSPGRMEKRR